MPHPVCTFQIKVPSILSFTCHFPLSAMPSIPRLPNQVALNSPGSPAVHHRQPCHVHLTSSYPFLFSESFFQIFQNSNYSSHLTTSTATHRSMFSTLPSCPLRLINFFNNLLFFSICRVATLPHIIQHRAPSRTTSAHLGRL